LDSFVELVSGKDWDALATDPQGWESKKAISVAGVRQHAAFIFAEDAIAVAGDEIVKNIAQTSRHYSPEGRENLPGTTQLTTRAQHGIRSIKDSLCGLLIIFHYVKRVEIPGIDSVSRQYRLGEVALE